MSDDHKSDLQSTKPDLPAPRTIRTNPRITRGLSWLDNTITSTTSALSRADIRHFLDELRDPGQPGPDEWVTVDVPPGIEVSVGYLWTPLTPEVWDVMQSAIISTPLSVVANSHREVAFFPIRRPLVVHVTVNEDHDNSLERLWSALWDLPVEILRYSRPRLTKHSAHVSGNSESFFKSLTNFQGLRILGLQNVRLSPSSTQHIQSLSSLFGLEINGEWVRANLQALGTTAPLPQLKNLALGRGISGNGARGLGLFPELEALSLEIRSFRDLDLRYLVSLPHLESLRFGMEAFDFEDRDTKEISQLPALKYLRLHNDMSIFRSPDFSPFTDLRELEWVAGGIFPRVDLGLSSLSYPASLESLWLEYSVPASVSEFQNDWNDGIFEAIERCTSLDHLGLRLFKAGDRDVSLLGSLHQLNSLYLDSTHDYDGDLFPLVAMSKLERLDFGSHAISRDMLHSLAQVAQLRALTLESNKVEMRDLAEFQQLRPDVELRLHGQERFHTNTNSPPR